MVRKTEAVKPGKREQRGVGDAALDLGEARLDIAAEVDDLEVWTQAASPAPGGEAMSCRPPRLAEVPQVTRRSR